MASNGCEVAPTPRVSIWSQYYSNLLKYRFPSSQICHIKGSTFQFDIEGQLVHIVADEPSPFPNADFFGGTELSHMANYYAIR